MPYAPAVNDRSGEILAQGLNNAFGAIADGIKQYGQNQALTKTAMAKFQGAVAASPDMLKLFESGTAPKEAQAAYDKIKKGKVDVWDATMLSGFSDSYAEQQQRQQIIDANRLKIDADNRRAENEKRTMNLYNALNSPAAGMVRPGIAQNPYVQQGAQLFGATGQMTSPGDLLNYDKAMAVANVRAESEAEKNKLLSIQRDLAEQLKEAQAAAKAKQTSFQDTKSLRESFYGLSPVKEFQVVDNYYSRGRMLAKQDTAAGDIGLVYSYMKVLDPTSAVREGEYATAQNSASIPQSIINIYNKALTGEKLQPTQRENFLKAMGNAASTQYSKVKPILEQHVKIASKIGADPEDVVPSYYSNWSVNRLSPAEAKAYLQMAGGDKDKAREMARKDGMEF